MDYNKIYQNKDVWGNEPNDLLQRVWPIIPTGSHFLDLGCGQGSDALFMAKQGFEVTAVEKDEAAIEGIKKYLESKRNFKNNIMLVSQNIIDFVIEPDTYQVIQAFNSLQFLTTSDAPMVIKKIKSGLSVGGFVVIAGFTKNDPLYQKPVNQHRCFFESQEMKRLFFDFEIIFYEEKMINDAGHFGYEKSHQHHVTHLIARKYEAK